MIRTRRIHLNPDEELIIHQGAGVEALAVRVVIGSLGGVQVFAQSRPNARCNVDLSQEEIVKIVEMDLRPGVKVSRFESVLSPSFNPSDCP